MVLIETATSSTAGTALWLDSQYINREANGVIASSESFYGFNMQTDYFSHDYDFPCGYSIDFVSISLILRRSVGVSRKR